MSARSSLGMKNQLADVGRYARARLARSLISQARTGTAKALFLAELAIQVVLATTTCTTSEALYVIDAISAERSNKHLQVITLHLLMSCYAYDAEEIMERGLSLQCTGGVCRLYVILYVIIEFGRLGTNQVSLPIRLVVS